VSVDDKRLERLEACEAVRRCVFRYALAGDRGNDGKILRGLFAEDATYEATGFGRFHGREAIAQGLEEIARDRVRWAVHVPGGPLIDVAEDACTAKAFWWVWVPVRLRVEGQDVPYWGAGHYNAELVHSPSGWVFQRLLFEPKLQTPFEGPWTSLEGSFHWPE
jgi:hypothetical protein